MKKFLVKIDNLCSSLLEIEAETKEEARVKAKDFFEHNKDYVLKLKDYYVSTTPPDIWPIILKDEFKDLKSQLDKQAKVKEQAALLIHRADIIDHRSRIRNRKSLMGTIEEYLLTKELIDVEKRVIAEDIHLNDEARKEVDKLLDNDIYNKSGLLKYLDPDARPWVIGDLILAKERCEIRMKDNKILNDKGINHFLENRDEYTEEEYQQLAKNAEERAKAFRKHHHLNKGKDIKLPPISEDK